MPLKIAKPDTRTDREHELLERRSRIELNRAQQKASIWACPIIPDAEVPIVLNIPSSTWQLRKRMQDAPPIFSIGKRSYVRTAELLAWCERLKFVPKQTHLGRVG